MKNEKDMLDKYRERIKRQNNKIKEDYDRVSATLPKGTIERIKALGLTINGVINESILSFLERAEEEQKPQQSEQPEQITTGKPKEKTNPVHEAEDFDKLNEYLKRLQTENEERRQFERSMNKPMVEDVDDE